MHNPYRQEDQKSPLEQFGVINLTDRAREEPDPAIGRDSEIRRVSQVQPYAPHEEQPGPDRRARCR